MLTGIFDTHAHYDSHHFAGHVEETLRDQISNGVVLIVNNGSDIASSRDSIALAQAYDFVYAAAGIHPCCSYDLPEDWLDTLRELCRQPKVVAVGEIGFDFHYDDTDLLKQEKAFRAQIELAMELDLPVQIHSRDSNDDLMRVLREYRPKGDIHRFSGTPDMAMEAVSWGMYLGFGGATTYKNSRNEKAAAAQIPLDRMLLETDCPYLAPAGHRGETNTSKLISVTAQTIAELRGTDAQSVIDACRENGRRLFGI